MKMTTKHVFKALMLCLAVALSLMSCEQLEWDAEDADADDVPTTKVTLTASLFSQIPFDEQSRAVGSIDAVCSKLSFVVFDEEEKVKAVHQVVGAESFGNVTIALAPGSYKVVVIAHSSASTASVAADGRTTFADNLVTDTFYACKELEVGEDPVSQTIEVERAVAMIRIVPTDALPESAKRLKFYYTGASSTFDPFTGFGCVNSRQTVYVDVVAGQDKYELYTFPHAQVDNIDLAVTALGDNDKVVAERKFEDLEVKVGMISQYKGSLFSESLSDGGISIVADPEWKGVYDIEP